MSRGDSYCADCGAHLAGVIGELDKICQACTLAQELCANRLLDKAAEKLRPTLSESNRRKLDRMRPELRREVARRALEAGHVKWVLT